MTPRSSRARPQHRDVIGADTYELKAPASKPPAPAARSGTKRTLDELEQAPSASSGTPTPIPPRRNYQRNWDAFERWCEAQGVCARPASVETLRRYLAHLAESRRAYSPIGHARSSIGLAHKHAGLPRPDDDPRIRMLERGIARERGEEGVTPLVEHEVARAVAALGNGPHADCDRALMLLGFAGAFRASDLAGLDVGSVRFLPDGSVRVHLRR